MKRMASSGALVRSATLAGIALFAVSAAPASAATVEFNNVTGTWFNSAGGSNVNYAGNGSGNAKVRWGDDLGQGQSGYNFLGSAFGPVVVSPPGSSGVFTIGTFEHVNFPIASGTAITGISLAFSADVIVNGTNLGQRTFNYNFSHWETPNGSNPCADGGAQGVGINVNGCADRVTMNFNSSSETFMIGSDVYTLNLAGFLVGGNPATQFWTKEDGVNTAYIQGKVDLYSVAVGVPEPATWAMMIFGFGAAGVAIRRRRKWNVEAA
jgi:hypothetical protein